MLAARIEVERCRRCGNLDKLFSLSRPEIAEGVEPEQRP
jgi:hypothetical protein